MCFDSWNSKTVIQSAELVEQTAGRATQVENNVENSFEGFKGWKFSIMEVRHQSRMSGIFLDGPALMLGDNKSVVVFTAIPSNILEKKHCAINWHRCQED